MSTWKRWLCHTAMPARMTASPTGTMKYLISYSESPLSLWLTAVCQNFSFWILLFPADILWSSFPVCNPGPYDWLLIDELLNHVINECVVVAKGWNVTETLLTPREETTPDYFTTSKCSDVSLHGKKFGKNGYYFVTFAAVCDSWSPNHDQVQWYRCS